MKLLKRMLYKNALLISATIGCFIMGCLVTLLWNTYISKIVNCISQKQSVPRELLIISFLCIALNIVITYVSGIVSGWTCETMSHKLRMGFTKHLLNQTYEESGEQSVGSQMSILQNEVAEISGYLSHNLSSIVSTTLSFFITIIYLLRLSPILTIITNAPTILILLYVNFSSRVIHNLTQKQQEQKKKMNGLVETLTNMLDIVHIYNANRFLGSKYDEGVEVWKGAAKKEESMKARLMSLSAVLSSIPLLILLFFGGKMVIQGEITLGVMYIFINLNKNVSGALMNKPGFIASFRRFTTNLDRVEQIIDL